MLIVKSILTHFDMFTCPATLRTEGKGSTGSYFTGFISTILACFFIYLFYHKSMDVFQFRDISFTKTFQTMSTDEPYGANLMFGVAMDMNVTQMMQYFHVYAMPMVNGSYNQTIQFYPCRPQQWQALGENYQQQFRLSNINNFLCPQLTESLDMKNVKFSPGYSYIKVVIQPCHLRNCLSWIYPPLDCHCKSQAQIQKYMLSKVTKEGYIGVWIKFLDQVVHTESENPVHHYINPDVFLTFTKTRGQIAFAQFDTFVVVTDVGVTPLTQNQYVKGFTLDSTTKYVSTEIPKFGDEYVRLQMSMSRKKHKFYRKIGKIDRAFSYVGGTLSLLVTIIAFFVKSYNEFKYELRVAEFTFNYDEFGDKVKQRQFTFWKYIHYTLVNWVYVLFLVDINTEQFRQIDDTRDQIGKQLSVQKIFKKIQVLQGSINFVMKDNYKYFLNLAEPPSIQTVRYRRLITEYYDAIVRGEQELTLSDFGDKRDQSKPKYNKLKGKNRSLRMKKEMSSQEMMQQRKTIGGTSTKGKEQITQLFSIPQMKPKQSQSKQKSNEKRRQISGQKQKRQINKEKNIQVLVDRAISQYPSIKKQADSINLSSQLLDTEMFLSQAFIQLREQEKYRICQKIPVKIIYRLLKITKSIQPS